MRLLEVERGDDIERDGGEIGITIDNDGAIVTIWNSEQDLCELLLLQPPKLPGYIDHFLVRLDVKDLQHVGNNPGVLYWTNPDGTEVEYVMKPETEVAL